MCIPRWLSGKESAKPEDAGDASSIPGSGGSSGVGNDEPVQYSCLENPMDKGAWEATACRVADSDMLSSYARAHTHTHTHTLLTIVTALYLSSPGLS